MATLTIRNLPDDVRDALRIRAARNRRSMEAEVRANLIEVAARTSSGDSDWRAAVAEAQGVVAPYRARLSDAVENLIAERRKEAAAEIAEANAWVKDHKPS